MKKKLEVLELTNEKHFKKIEDGLYEQVDQSAFVESILEDGTDKIFMPETFRMHSSYEVSQLMRFWIAVNWMREAHVKNVPLENVLDLGCSHSKLYQCWHNNGNFMNWPNLHYFGVDADKRRLLNGRSKIKKKKKDKMTHVLGDISKVLQFPVKFQVVVSMETFEHIPKDRLKYLFKTAHRNLVDNAVLIISGENPDHEKGESGVYRDSEHRHHYEWPHDEVRALAEKTGFEVDAFTTFHAKNTYGRKDHSVSLKAIYDTLKKSLPTSFVNNICSMLDTEHPFNGKQWAMKLVKLPE